MQEITRLNSTDIRAIESRVQAEIATLPEPTIELLQAQGYSENRRLNAALAWISGAGRVVTLFIAEFIQAFAAIALAVVFIALEAERIMTGVIALGQHQEQAALIAVAFTVANGVTPIYRLRNLRGRKSLTRLNWTVWGYLKSFWRRLTGQPQAYEVDVYDNPTLGFAEAAITWATLFLAFYAVLGPQLAGYQDQPWYVAMGAVFTESSLTEMLGLLAGLLLAFGGVFGVQSISHEIGVRTITDQPTRLADLLAHQQAERAAHIEAIRQRITSEHMAGKVADEQRKKGAAAIEVPLVTSPPSFSMNGNGKHHSSDHDQAGG